MAAGGVHINALPESNLAQIFKNMPPYDRLRVSEVCKRWFSVSQDPWREVTRLELTSIPSQSVGAILRKCPNLTHLLCEDVRLILDDLRDITLCSLKALELHGCTFVSFANPVNKTALPLFGHEHRQTVEELVLHEHQFGVEVFLPERHSQRLLPRSLRRLQLSGINRQADSYAQNRYLTELRNLDSLESLILHTSNVSDDSTHREFTSLIDHAVACLDDNLRELLVSPMSCGDEADPGDYFRSTEDLLFFALYLSRLEILFFPDNLIVDTDNPKLLDVFTKNPSLRVLVLQGEIQAVNNNVREVQVPVRRRFSDPAEPLPFLHVFVGLSAAEFFRFDDSPTNGLKVHSIDAPLPELLEREEVREIFGDSWIAEQIREGAKRGMDFCAYPGQLVKAV